MKNRNFFAQRKRSVKFSGLARRKWQRQPVKVRLMRERLQDFAVCYRGMPSRTLPLRAYRLREVLSYPPGQATAWGNITKREMWCEMLVRVRAGYRGHIGPLWWF